MNSVAVVRLVRPASGRWRAQVAMRSAVAMPRSWARSASGARDHGAADLIDRLRSGLDRRGALCRTRRRSAAPSGSWGQFGCPPGGGRLLGGAGVDRVGLGVLAAHPPVGLVDIEDSRAGGGEHTGKPRAVGAGKRHSHQLEQHTGPRERRAQQFQKPSTAPRAGRRPSRPPSATAECAAGSARSAPAPARQVPPPRERGSRRTSGARSTRCAPSGHRSPLSARRCTQRLCTRPLSHIPLVCRKPPQQN